MSKLFKKNQEINESTEEVSKDLSDVAEQIELVELNSTAYSVAKNSSGQWVVVSIKYDVDTKTVGDIVILDSMSEKVFAVDKMKIEIARNLLF